jgi:hypothetical protein
VDFKKRTDFLKSTYGLRMFRLFHADSMKTGETAKPISKADRLLRSARYKQ